MLWTLTFALKVVQIVVSKFLGASVGGKGLEQL